jgi:hypothetical protein
MLLLVVCLMVASAFGANGKITGRVVDSETGQALPGANVLIEGTTMGASTDVEGNYFILNVPPGVYTVRAEMIGFATQRVTDVRVSLDLTTNIDFETKVEAVEGEEVTIVSVRPVIQEDIGGSEINIDIEAIRTAGAFQDVNKIATSQVSMSTVGSTSNRVEIRGNAIEQSLFIVDGVEQGDPITTRPLYTINVDAIQEVKVQTGGFDAKYGNFRSGIINVVIKEGGQSYSGSVDGNYSREGLKHFGPSMFGHDSPLSVPFVDADVGAFTGNDFFQGWNAVANNELNPGDAHYGSPEERYALWLWRHRSKDSIEKLKDLANGGLAPNGQPVDIQWAEGIDPDEQVWQDTGDDPDYHLNATFGGPVPGLNSIRKSTFFGTWSQSQLEYAHRFPSLNGAYRDYEARGKMTTWLSTATKLATNVYWSTQRGGEGGQGPGLDGRISSDPFRQFDATNKFWYPHCAVEGRQNRMIGGLGLTHTFSPNTFLDLRLTHRRTDYEMLRDLRETAPLPGTIGGQPGRYGESYGDAGLPSGANGDSGVLEGRIGTTAEAEAREAAGQDGWQNWRDWTRIQIGSYWYDEGPEGYDPVQYRDITGEYRMSSCNLRNNETYSRSWEIEGDLVSQVNRHNQLNAGFRFRKDDLQLIYEAIDPSVNGGSIDLANADEWQLGLYLQDRLEFKGFFAKVGLRADVLSLSDYPSLDFSVDANGKAIAAGDKVSGPYSDLILAGATLDENGNFNTFSVIPLKSETKVVLSPRVSVSHPISSTAKLFFNYGHQYQWQQPFDRYRINYGTTAGNRVTRYGNPFIEPPRTIAYELGYEHNIGDAVLLRLTGYFQDINNESGEFRFYPIGYGGGEYRIQDNQDFRDTKGIELYTQLRRNTLSEFFSGSASVNYLVESEGRFGYEFLYENPSSQPRQVPSQVSNPDVRPIVRFSASFHAPEERFGALLGNADLSVSYNWRRGQQFTWNPASVPLVEDNLRWTAYQRMDLRFTKQLFRTGGIFASFYMDVFNVLNQKNMIPWFVGNFNADVEGRIDFAWNGHKWWKNQEFDYMNSLGYTADNQNTDGSFNNTNGNPGEDKGDLPGFTPWTFLESRDVFFGFRFTF